jgi:hypothetical protein
MAVWGWCAIGIDISVAALMQHNYSPKHGSNGRRFHPTTRPRLFDRISRTAHGDLRLGIYDNMKTSVETIFVRKVVSTSD